MTKTNFYDISEIKTQPIYYFPLLFEDYDIIEYKPKNRKILSDSNLEENEFIIGKGKLLNHVFDDNLSFHTYEWFDMHHQVISDAGFLQSILTASAQLMNERGHRKPIGDNERMFALSFCRKYGLDNDSLYTLNIKNKDPLPHQHGFNLWKFIWELQSIYISFTRISNLLDDIQSSKYDIPTISWSNAVLQANGTYCTETKKIIQVLTSSSLLNIAKYQLIKIMADNAYIRQCANPKCNSFIIDGRADKKTCSDACRKAYERFLNKNPLRTGANNHTKKKS